MLPIIANFKKFCRFVLVGFKIPIRFRKLEHGVKNPPRLGVVFSEAKVVCERSGRAKPVIYELIAVPWTARIAYERLIKLARLL